MDSEQLRNLEKRLEKVEKILRSIYASPVEDPALSPLQRKINKLVGITDEDFLAINKRWPLMDERLSEAPLQERVDKLAGLSGKQGLPGLSCSCPDKEDLADLDEQIRKMLGLD